MTNGQILRLMAAIVDAIFYPMVAYLYFMKKFSVAAEKYDPEADEEGDKVKVALIVSVVGLRLGNSVEIFLKFVMTVLL